LKPVVFSLRGFICYYMIQLLEQDDLNVEELDAGADEYLLDETDSEFLNVAVWIAHSILKFPSILYTMFANM